MKKKNYSKPSVKTVDFQPRQVIADSGTSAIVSLSIWDMIFDENNGYDDADFN